MQKPVMRFASAELAKEKRCSFQKGVKEPNVCCEDAQSDTQEINSHLGICLIVTGSLKCISDFKG